MSETILTPAQTCGPLFGFALFPEGLNQSADPDASDSVTVEGLMLDGAGEPVGYGSFIEFWSEGQATRARTLDGRFGVTLQRPRAEPAEDGGTPAPCLNILVFTRGLARPLFTRLYFPDQAALHAGDPVLQRVAPERRARLLARPGSEPRHFTHDIHLQGERETVFFAVDPS